jgi:hypothetical protein
MPLKHTGIVLATNGIQGDMDGVRRLELVGKRGRLWTHAGSLCIRLIHCSIENGLTNTTKGSWSAGMSQTQYQKRLERWRIPDPIYSALSIPSVSRNSSKPDPHWPMYNSLSPLHPAREAKTMLSSIPFFAGSIQLRGYSNMSQDED